MTTVGDVTKWAGLVSGIILTSLLALLGTVESAHWRIIGFLTEADFTDVISPWRIPSEALDAAAAAGTNPPTPRAPTPAERSQAGLVGRACRVLAGKQANDDRGAARRLRRQADKDIAAQELADEKAAEHLRDLQRGKRWAEWRALDDSNATDQYHRATSATRQRTSRSQRKKNTNSRSTRWRSRMRRWHSNHRHQDRNRQRGNE